MDGVLAFDVQADKRFVEQFGAADDAGVAESAAQVVDAVVEVLPAGFRAREQLQLAVGLRLDEVGGAHVQCADGMVFVEGLVRRQQCPSRLRDDARGGRGFGELRLAAVARQVHVVAHADGYGARPHAVAAHALRDRLR